MGTGSLYASDRAGAALRGAMTRGSDRPGAEMAAAPDGADTSAMGGTCAARDGGQKGAENGAAEPTAPEGADCLRATPCGGSGGSGGGGERVSCPKGGEARPQAELTVAASTEEAEERRGPHTPAEAGTRTGMPGCGEFSDDTAVDLGAEVSSSAELDRSTPRPGQGSGGPEGRGNGTREGGNARPWPSRRGMPEAAAALTAGAEGEAEAGAAGLITASTSATIEGPEIEARKG